MNKKGEYGLAIFMIILLLGIILGYIFLKPETMDIFKKHYNKFELSNGDIICCSWYSVGYSGASFTGCKDGNEYFSQVNIKQLGECND